VTAGGSSTPAVQALLAVLAAGRRCGEAGTAFGEGAAAMAATASSVVTAELDPERARAARERLCLLDNVELVEGDWRDVLPPRGPFELLFLDGGSVKQDPEEHLPPAVALLETNGLLVLDDFTPGRTNDVARNAVTSHPELAFAEVLVGLDMVVIVAARVPSRRPVTTL
jgi:predicted O-methyltransferase YrrM